MRKIGLALLLCAALIAGAVVAPLIQGIAYATIVCSVPNTFATQSGNIPVSQIDANFSAIITCFSGVVAASTDLPLTRAYTGTQRWAQGVGLTAAGTLTLGSDGNYFVVAGNTGINGLSTLEAGTVIRLRFTGTPLLTHSATFVLQGAANYTAASGDVFVFISEGGGTWREVTRRAVTNADTSHFWRGDGTWGTPSTAAGFTTCTQPVRALATIYQNTGTTPIMVTVNMAAGATNTYATTAKLDTVTPPVVSLGIIEGTAVAAGSANSGTWAFIVPVNYYYTLTEGSSGSVNKWTECS